MREGEVNFSIRSALAERDHQPGREAEAWASILRFPGPNLDITARTERRQRRARPIEGQSWVDNLRRKLFSK